MCSDVETNLYQLPMLHKKKISNIRLLTTRSFDLATLEKIFFVGSTEGVIGLSVFESNMYSPDVNSQLHSF